MKKKAVRLSICLMLFASCVQLTPCAAATELSPEYLYEDAEQVLPFSVPGAELRAVDTPEKARRVFRDALDALSEADKAKPYV
ncbi:MAG: hypothetical protein LBE16_07195, partial [Clostridiales Family XIII bacterium]|nr:hypothetical protein [Clostridiales Family XIII bacterium]